MAKVTFRHLRQLHYCKDHISAWCQRHGYSMRAFRRGAGVDSDELRATGCGFAIRAADLADAQAAEQASE